MKEPLKNDGMQGNEEKIASLAIRSHRARELSVPEGAGQLSGKMQTNVPHFVPKVEPSPTELPPEPYAVIL